jgi:UDP-N-acetylglucosamine--N-acetylmuramyl-(pentapeptide) pyrophosphoryl-undecaprenol N-acetylglucosamine transferase
MTNSRVTPPYVVIACGGTGGHLFPGLAVAEELSLLGAQVLLLTSEKEVDRQALQSLAEIESRTLPAVGLQNRNLIAFGRGFLASLRAMRAEFSRCPPDAVLSMGGFTGAAPLISGRWVKAVAFIHEANTIPGRANRWLAPLAQQIFTGFEVASKRFRHGRVACTGTPVRKQFQPQDPGACRMALGLAAELPTLLVMGGSQGAHPINELMLEALPLLNRSGRALQIVHLTGTQDHVRVRDGYRRFSGKAVIRPFLSEMELALGAATLAVNRAGASSLAEMAALGVPAILIPYPAAADDHQWHNAQVWQNSGAARLLPQPHTTSQGLADVVCGLMADESAREAMRQAVLGWSSPHAAELIAARICQAVSPRLGRVRTPTAGDQRTLASAVKTGEWGAR